MTDNLYDIFSENAPAPKLEPTPPAPPPYDPEEYKARKEQERQETYEMLDGTTDKLRYNGELFQTYLDVQARFNRYSVNNCILITAQRPDATKLADYDTWKDGGAQVGKGEKALVILEPHGTYERQDGTKATNYAPKKVFDISQTNAEPEPAPTVTREERALLKALITNAPCEFAVSDDMPENYSALYRPETKTIVIRAGMDAPAIFRSLASELAHANMDRGAYNRSECALVANYTSYILCKRYGVPTDSFRFDATPERFKKMEVREFRQELGRIRDVANTISANMTRALEPQQKEQPQTRAPRSAGEAR